MTTREYLAATNLTELELSEILGFKSTAPIMRKIDDEMPVRWTRKLEELSSQSGDHSDTVDRNDEDNNSERESNLFNDSDLNDWISSDGRDQDKDPNLDNVNSGNKVIGPQQIKLTTVKGYIEMIYGGGAQLARTRGDLIAAEVIEKYTPEYVEAWMDYIKYDPRILKYLEQLNIGTPLGNLIGVHAVSIGAYVFARVTAKEIAARYAESPTGETEL